MPPHPHRKAARRIIDGSWLSQCSGSKCLGTRLSIGDEALHAVRSPERASQIVDQTWEPRKPHAAMQKNTSAPLKTGVAQCGIVYRTHTRTRTGTRREITWIRSVRVSTLVPLCALPKVHRTDHTRSDALCCGWPQAPPPAPCFVGRVESIDNPELAVDRSQAPLFSLRCACFPVPTASGGSDRLAIIAKPALLARLGGVRPSPSRCGQWPQATATLSASTIWLACPIKAHWHHESASVSRAVSQRGRPPSARKTAACR